ncbi:MAG TPA: hypothetical protein VKB94_07245, partial [Rhizomicrobium sp.]|nr:hypothetical protein [Rhizomicrobium sp.]
NGLQRSHTPRKQKHHRNGDTIIRWRCCQQVSQREPAEFVSKVESCGVLGTMFADPGRNLR